MLKTITPFQLGDHHTINAMFAENIEAALTEPTARDPEKTMWACAGFSQPSHFGSTPVFVSADGTRVLNVQIRERILPAKVINIQLAERLVDAEKRQGYKPGRKQVAEIKEALTMELLPNSHIRHIDIPVMLVADYLLIGASSARHVDVALSLLYGLFPEDNDLLFRPLAARRNVSGFLADVLLGNTTDSCFSTGQSVTLKGTDKSVARYKSVDLDSDPVNDSVSAGMLPVDLEVLFSRNPGEEARLMFTLTDNLLIKRLKFSDFVMQDHESDHDGDKVSSFDANVALTAAEVRGLLDQVCVDIPAIVETDPIEDDEL